MGYWAWLLQGWSWAGVKTWFRMAARVHPAPVEPTEVAETSLNGAPDSAGHAGRFLRYSAWSLSPEHNDNGECKQSCICTR